MADSRADGGRRRTALAALIALAALAAVGAALGIALGVDGGNPATPPQAAADLAAYAERLRNSADPYFGTRQLAYLEEQLANPTFDSHTWRVSVLRQLAFHRLRLGDADSAIDLLEEAADIAELHMPRSAERDASLDDLAVALMKRGELRNCVSPEGRLVCALPLDPEYAHADASDVRRAIGLLDGLLERDPTQVRRRWLLNVAHMAAGSYPDGVTEHLRVPPEAFAPQREIGRFEEMGVELGIQAVELAGGAIVEDFDNDGLLEIMTSTWDPSGGIKYYRSVREGDSARFVESAASAGLAGQVGGLNMTQADYDNDGRMDALVMRGGWLMANGQMRMSLLRNERGVDGGARFVDVTRDVGLALPAYPSQSAAWADYDNDGDLDLYSCSESMPESPEEGAATVYPSRLFRNDGADGFTDVAASAGVRNMRYCKGSAWGDYDNDGDPDLYVSNYAAENRLYRNDGGAFVDVAPNLGIVEPIESFPTWFWDYDNDGWLDLFVAGYARDIDSVAADYMGMPSDGARPRLYRNDGAGGFEDVTAQAGLDDVNQTMGANYGDLDADGFPDVLLGVGFPAFDALAPNVAYLNDAGESFHNTTFSAGLGHIQKGHAIAFGDLDRDGDEDVFMQVGGFYPGDGFLNALYVNPTIQTAGSRWIAIRLVGIQSNRSAIGARVRVDVRAPSGARSIHSLVGSGGSFGASSVERQIGLGDALAIESLEVWWPTSGIRQTFPSPPMDAAIEITEGVDGYAVLERPRLRLSGER